MNVTRQPRRSWGLHPPTQHIAIVLGVAVLLALAWYSYGYCLRLPFFLDDMIHFRWLSSQSLPEVWSSAEGLGYFRPLAFTIVASGTALLVLAGIVAISLSFPGQRARAYEQVREAVVQLLPLRGDAGERLLCINYPWYLAPRQARYAVGHEGVTLVPPYVGLAELLWVHTGAEYDVEAAILPDLVTPWEYHTGLVGKEHTAESLQPRLRRSQRVLVTQYGGAGLRVLGAGGLEAKSTVQRTEYLAAFGGGIALCDASYCRQGSWARLELNWQCWRPPEGDTTIFVHLYDAHSRLVAQADGYPLLGAARLTA